MYSWTILISFSILRVLLGKVPLVLVWRKCDRTGATKIEETRIQTPTPMRYLISHIPAARTSRSLACRDDLSSSSSSCRAWLRMRSDCNCAKRNMGGLVDSEAYRSSHAISITVSYMMVYAAAPGYLNHPPGGYNAPRILTFS